MYEAGGAAALGGIQVRPLATDAGVLSPEQVDDAVRPLHDPHQPHTAVVSVENTHNRHGGVVWPIESLEAVADVARRRGIKFHMDGARIFNAALALGVDVKEVARPADTVTFCLSKGLGCPVGSVLCGTTETIAQAKRWRKMLGGGWRQAGVLAAAGLYALDHMVDRLAEDHANARTLAEGLAEMDGVSIELSRVQSNIVYFRLTRMSAKDFVTHYGIEPADVQHALEVCNRVLG
jgi:threonine aldolase